MSGRGVPVKPYRRRSARGNVPFALTLTSLVIAAALPGEPGRLRLRHQADANRAGEIWRLLTAHLVHPGGSHNCYEHRGSGSGLVAGRGVAAYRYWLLVYSSAPWR